MRPADAAPQPAAGRAAPEAGPAQASGYALWALAFGIASVFCIVPGPVLGIVAIGLGILARAEIARSQGRLGGAGLAAAGVAMGTFSFVVFAGLVGAYLAAARHAPAAELPVTPSSPPVVASPAPTPAAPAPEAPDAGAPTFATASTVTSVGKITVVDVAPGVASLSRELQDQRVAAAAHGERLLVQTTKPSGCIPCDGVAAALGDARMQKALAGVRLVRVDVDVFGEDLEDLKIPVPLIPGFFLIDASLHVTDAIHGGEWDDDVAANIAPVLGPFLRGTYTKRRDPWRATPRPTGTVM